MTSSWVPSQTPIHAQVPHKTGTPLYMNGHQYINGQQFGYALGEVRGQSRVEYVPFQRKVIEYEEVEEFVQVPYERKVIEYEQHVRIEKVPVMREYTDYYTIEHVTEYIPQMVPETKIEYVPVEKTYNRLEYVPVERQVVHHPDDKVSSRYRQGMQNSGEWQFTQHQTKGGIANSDFTSSKVYADNLPLYPVYNPGVHDLTERTGAEIGSRRQRQNINTGINLTPATGKDVQVLK